MTTPVHIPFKRQAVLGACMAALLALSACGGGDDDDGPPATAEAPASDCLGPQQAHWRWKYRVIGTMPSTFERDVTIGERAQFNGQQVLRDTSLEQLTYAATAPANYAGHVNSTAGQTYYIINPDLSTSIHARAVAGRWDDWPEGEQAINSTIYNPPAVDPMFTLKTAGQSITYAYKGVQRNQARDGTITTETEEGTATVTYHGQETVEVPAGRFTACKFTSGDEIIWRAKDSGINVKVEGDEPFVQGKRRTLELTEYQQL